MEEKRLCKDPIKGIQPDMAPKEQIQQHEWVPLNSSSWRDECVYCRAQKHKGLFHGKRVEYVVNHMIHDKEPACITRPINAPQREAD